MNRLTTILTACLAGLIVGLCAAVLVVPQVARVDSFVDVSADVPDHGQGSVRGSSPSDTQNTQPGTSAVQQPVSTEDAALQFGLKSLSSISTDMLDAAFAAKLDWTVKPGTRVILIPHHLVAARQIASLVSAVPKPTVVYLVTPDHFYQCPSDVCAPSVIRSSASASTTWSDVDLNVLQKEIAFPALMPFISKAMPDATVVPVMVRLNATEQDRLTLSSILTKKLQDDPNALLIATVDFSHYQPAEVADFHDVLAQDVIASLADLEADRVELDSPGVLAVALKTARQLGLGDVTIQAHTNSLRLLNAEISQESTSHFLVSFAPGDMSPQQDATMLFTGDIMLDRNVAARIKKSGTDDYAFQKIRGKENRFFRGQDLVVGNLEGPIASKRQAPNKGEVDFMFDAKFVKVLKAVGFDAVSQANNHASDQGAAAARASAALLTAGGLVPFGDQYGDGPDVAYTIIERRGKKIALVGFDAFTKKLDRQAAGKSLSQARAAADFVVVFVHWGAEYQAKPNKDQVELGRWFVDNGADAVIGSHPHWMQSLGVYKGRPIAYSLGNFVFDQDWSQETDFGLVAGLVLNKRGSELHLFPVKIANSQPALLTGKDRQARLDRLASISDKNLSSQIKQGVLYLTNK